METPSVLSKSRQFLICKLCSYSIPVANKTISSVDCERCGHENHLVVSKSARLTTALSLTALIFYIPANVFPFMTVEMYGRQNSSTIWQGVVSLVEGGSYLIAFVIFVASIIVPALKILILFYLSLVAKKGKNPRFHTKLYHFVEVIGRWSMLDIFLLAVLVSILKLGKLTSVHAEVGSLMFLFVVIFTMLASAYFDPQILWSDKDETTD